MVKCVGCEEKIKKGEECHSDITGKPVCETCYYEAEPCATVHYSSTDDDPKVITEYRDETEGDFKVKWHSTDPWRGYYDVESENWANVHEDCILASSQDAEELEKFQDALMAQLDGVGIEYARIFTRTSNLFSAGFDFFVRKENAVKAKAIAVMLALRYRNPERFSLTALTGKDTFDEKDKMFLKATKMIGTGLSNEEIIEKIQKEVEA